MPDSPTSNADGPVGVILKLNGAAAADTLMIVSVKVYKRVGRIPEAVVTLETGSIAEQDFEDVDGADFDLGTEIEISALYGEGQAGVLFTGVIYGKRMRIRAGNPPQMILTCRDKAAAMNVVKKTVHFAQQTDSDAMSQVIADAGLTADIGTTTMSVRDQLQHNCTDWDFLRVLADRNGYVLVAEDGNVHSAPPDSAGSAVLTLTLGVDIIAFDAEADTRGLIGAASGASWDEAAQEIVQNDGETPPDPTWGNLTGDTFADVIGAPEHRFTTPDTMEAADIKIMASARRSRSVLSALQGRCSFPGSAVPLPDTVIQITGVGERFGGNAYVSGVDQNIEGGSWTTEVTLGLPDDWRSDSSDLGGADAAGLSTPIRGLQIGKVVGILNDPSDRLRVKINLPMIGQEETLVWARFATPYATAGSGIQFMPEIGDEVVVDFLNADPNAPVVLGSLHNGSNARPYEPDEPNTFKGIVSKSLMKIEFDDDQKILTLETPGGHSVVLDDKGTIIAITDSNGNSMEMDGSGIKLDSSGDITLKAAGNIVISAAGDASVDGVNVNLTARSQLKASGSAGAELSASGNTVVKGAMVMIN